MRFLEGDKRRFGEDDLTLLESDSSEETLALLVVDVTYGDNGVNGVGVAAVVVE